MQYKQQYGRSVCQFFWIGEYFRNSRVSLIFWYEPTKIIGSYQETKSVARKSGEGPAKAAQTIPKN